MKRDPRAGVPSYTYRQFKTEEKVLYKRLAIIIGLTLVLFIILWFWGVWFIRIIGFLGTRGDGGNNTEITLPLQKPILDHLPEFTNKDKITISGSTTAGVSVQLFVNATEISSTKADNSGVFNFVDVPLTNGLNLLKVIASGDDGEKEEEKATITLDTKPPDLQVSQPADKQTFPKDTQQISVVGTTEPDTTVLINAIQATLDKNGNFNYKLSVTSGENKVEVKSVDKAGNEKVINLIIQIGS